MFQNFTVDSGWGSADTAGRARAPHPPPSTESSLLPGAQPHTRPASASFLARVLACWLAYVMRAWGTAADLSPGLRWAPESAAHGTALTGTGFQWVVTLRYSVAEGARRPLDDACWPMAQFSFLGLQSQTSAGRRGFAVQRHRRGRCVLQTGRGLWLSEFFLWNLFLNYTKNG